MMKNSVRIHATNVTGAGATNLAISLLAAMNQAADIRVSTFYVPNDGALTNYVLGTSPTRVFRYKRRLPNVISRLLECLFFSRYLDSSESLLVLGDIPLRTRSPQTVFVQTSHLCRPDRIQVSLGWLKFAFMRLVFRFNSDCAQSYIVQSYVMKRALSATYPSIADKITVIAQPVPGWLLYGTKKKKTNLNEKLRLIYPATYYPHKNHKVLGKVNTEMAASFPIEELVLTVPTERHPAPHISWISCVGFLPATEMKDAYLRSDALLFLSKEESYGFPLIEAMFLGLPIVCSDLPYARALCGDGAIYFDPDSEYSLLDAICVLYKKMSSGWFPNWKSQLQGLPDNWDDVARQIMRVIYEE